jgi:hypothetical protein
VTAGGWPGALDDFARCLAEQEQLLDQERYEDIRGFEPPSGLGPLPLELAAQARELAGWSELLTSRVQQALSATGRQMALLRHLGGGTAGSRSMYVDQNA